MKRNHAEPSARFQDGGGALKRGLKLPQFAVDFDADRLKHPRGWVNPFLLKRLRNRPVNKMR